MHPLIEMVGQYVREFPNMKEDHEDLNNLVFHRDHGLYLDCPKEWPTYEAIQQAMTSLDTGHSSNVVVIYPSTAIYNEIKEVIGEGLTADFFAWQELFAAIHRVSEDARYLKQLKNVLARADLVVFLGVSTAMKDVVDQVRANVNGCLLLFA